MTLKGQIKVICAGFSIEPRSIEILVMYFFMKTNIRQCACNVETTTKFSKFVFKFEMTWLVGNKCIIKRRISTGVLIFGSLGRIQLCRVEPATAPSRWKDRNCLVIAASADASAPGLRFCFPSWMSIKSFWHYPTFSFIVLARYLENWTPACQPANLYCQRFNELLRFVNNE